MTLERRSIAILIVLAFLMTGSSSMGLTLAEKNTSEDPATSGGALPATSSRATFTVGPSQTYTTIQAAVTAASSGDTIRVWAGSYDGGATVDKQLTIIGNGSSDTILSGSGFTVSANGCRISGMGFRNTGVARSGTAVYITSDNVNVDNCSFDHMYWGIYLYNADQCYIADCSDNNSRYGYYSYKSTYNTFENVSADLDSYAMYMLNTMDTYSRIACSTFRNNTRGIYVTSSSHLDLLNNTFENNEKGIWLLWSSVIRCENNTHHMDGKAITLSSSHVAMLNNRMYGCGVVLYGASTTWQGQRIDLNNLVNSRPLCYLDGVTSGSVPPGTGQIILSGCSGLTIHHQDLSNASIGIQLGYCTNITIAHVNCSENPVGIYSYFSNGNTLRDSLINDSGKSVELTYSNSNVIKDCSFSGSDVGMNILSSKAQYISNSTFTGCGIRMSSYSQSYYDSCTIPSNNTVNGRPLLYLKNQTGMTVTGSFGQVIMANCTSVTLNNQNLSHATIGVQLFYCSGIVLSNITGMFNQDGIYLTYTDMTLITGCNLRYNTRGIYFGYSVSAIRLRTSVLKNNDVSGIYMEKNVHDSRIENCNISSNGEYGITMGITSPGSGPYRNRITNCTLMDQTTGLLMQGYASDNTVDNCTFMDQGVGVWIYSYCERNLVGNSTFGGNSIGIFSQSYCSSNNISNCRIDSDGMDIKIERDEGLGVYNVRMSRGIFISGTLPKYWEDHQLSSTCTVNSKPLVYITRATGISLSVDAGQMIVASSSYLDIQALNVSGVCCGLLIGFSDLNHISNSSFDSNINGINMDYCDDNVLTGNTFRDSTGYAVDLNTDCSANLIRFNNFISNNPGGTQVRDNGSSDWNASGYGNHWDDWTGPDADHNGIVDVPYELDGIGSRRDDFPLVSIYGSPEILTPPRTTATEDRLYSVEYTGTDPNTPPDQLVFSCQTNASWLRFLPNNTLFGTPTNSDIGVFHVNITLTDGILSDRSDFEITVINVNDDPIITTSPANEAVEDELYRVTFIATDVDPVTPTFTWSVVAQRAFLSMESDSGELSGTPLNEDVGSLWVNVSVSDGSGGTGYLNYTLNVMNSNDPPTWVEVPEDITLSMGEEFTFLVNATDIDAGDTLAFSISSQPSVPVTFGTYSGQLRISPDTAGVFLMNLSATDSVAIIYHEFTVTVVAANAPPVAMLVFPGNDAMISVLNPTLSWETTDYDSDPVTVDVYLGSLLSGVNLKYPTYLLEENTSSSVFAVSEPFAPGETYYWTVYPNDGMDEGTCSSGIWSFTVSENATFNNPPRFISHPGLQAAVGTPWTYTPMAVDDEGEAVDITFKNGPTGMSWDGDSLSWTPGALGNYTVEIQATDGTNIVEQVFYIMVVSELAPNLFPTIATVEDSTTTEGDLVRLRINASDPDGDELTFELNGPPRSNVSSTGLFSWQTQEGDVGTYTITIYIDDGRGGTNSTSFNIVVLLNNTGISIPNGNTSDGDGNASGSTGLLVLILVLVLLLVVVAMVVVVIVKRRGAEAGDGIDHYAIEKGTQGTDVAGKDDIFTRSKQTNSGASSTIIEQSHLSPPPVQTEVLPPVADTMAEASMSGDGSRTLEQPELQALPPAGLTSGDTPEGFGEMRPVEEVEPVEEVGPVEETEPVEEVEPDDDDVPGYSLPDMDGGD